jgi:hypothetical protein
VSQELSGVVWRCPGDFAKKRFVWNLSDLSEIVWSCQNFVCRLSGAVGESVVRADRKKKQDVIAEFSKASVSMEG